MNRFALVAGLVWAAGGQSISSAPVSALAFSADGSELVSSGHKKIVIHSPTNGIVLGSVECNLARISSLGFHPGGRILAVAGGTPGVSGEGMLMDWKQRKILQRFTNFTDLATCIAFGSDGNLLAIASADHSTQVLRFDSNQTSAVQAFTLKGHAGPILAVAFSPDGKTIVTGSTDRSLKVWSAQDGRLIRSFSHHTEAVHVLAFRPQLKSGNGESAAMCASGSDDQTVRIWQPEIGRMVRIIRKHEGAIFALVFTPDGKSLFSAGKEGMVRRLNPESDLIVGEWKAHEDWIYSLAVSPDGHTLATGDWAGKVKLWDVSSKTVRQK